MFNFYRHDPDILLGYEVTMMSWGYLIDRAASLNLNLTNQLSRVPRELIMYPEIASSFFFKITDQPDNKASSERTGSGTGTRHKASPVRIPGRIVVSVWRLMRKELALTSYSFENTYFQVVMAIIHRLYNYVYSRKRVKTSSNFRWYCHLVRNFFCEFFA